MGFWERKNEILGINARNLLYINRYNAKVNKSFADNKIFTKNYLQSRGIGVARLYSVIRSYREMLNFDPSVLPDSFVIKPNRGFGGEGIIPIRSTKNGVYTSISGRRYRWDDLQRECISILEGRYAISGLHDQVIFEELLEPDKVFEDAISKGLPDIRIIVFNFVPVLAMLRLPTPESDGRANLHLGALGIGIDIATGKATYAVRRHKPVKTLPNGKPISSLQMPKWQEVLQIAARAQQVSQIGFLAVDVALTKTGIKILELNARAGLDIQIANRVPLKNRLHKVRDLDVGTPQQGVTIATTIFSSAGAARSARTEKKPDVGKPIIGLYEHVEVLNTKYHDVLAKVDPHAKTSIVDHSFKDEIESHLLDVKLAGKRIDLPFEYGDLQNHQYKMIIAGKYLKEFLIDITSEPQKKATQRPTGKKQAEENIIKNLDRKIFEIDRQLSILTYLKPLNLQEEKKNFLDNPAHSPRFIYRKLRFDVREFKKEIKRLPQNIDHPLMPLFKEKIAELNRKVSLLEARGTEKIQYQSERLYGRVSRELYATAVDEVKRGMQQEDKSELLSFRKIQKTLEQYLKDHKLSHWRLNITDNASVDMATNRRNVITLRRGVEFTQNRLSALITHEIETHVFRLENGRNQSFKMFEIGTAGYGSTEEGLAVYNQNLLDIALGEKNLWPALNVIGVYLGRKMSFAELYDHLRVSYALNEEGAWKICFKVKRGLLNTETKATFAKDMIYYAGRLAVEQFVAAHGKEALVQLYVGKIGITDLPQLGNVQLAKPKHVPAVYSQFLSHK